MNINWREEYQRVHLDCISRDVQWVQDKTRAIVGYARYLSSPPIIKDAAEEIAAAETVLADALADIREARLALKIQKVVA